MQRMLGTEVYHDPHGRVPLPIPPYPTSHRANGANAKAASPMTKVSKVFRHQREPRHAPFVYDQNKPLSPARIVHDQKECLLLTRLPLEIREQIWAYCLALGEPIHMRDRTCRPVAELCPYPNDFSQLEICYHTGFASDFLSLSLLGTCYRIYAEATPILYSRNTFNVESVQNLLEMPSRFVPQTFNLISSLFLQRYVVPGCDDSRSGPKLMIREYERERAWPQMWKLLARMENLKQLHVVWNICFRLQGDWVRDQEKLFKNVKQMTKPKEVWLSLSWDPRERMRRENHDRDPEWYITIGYEEICKLADRPVDLLKVA